jgi:hypothetical protein
MNGCIDREDYSMKWLLKLIEINFIFYFLFQSGFGPIFQRITAGAE